MSLGPLILGMLQGCDTLPLTTISTAELFVPLFAANSNGVGEGPPVAFTTSDTAGYKSVAALDSDHFVIAYRDEASGHANPGKVLSPARCSPPPLLPSPVGA